MKDDKPHWIGQGKGASAIGSSTSAVGYKKSQEVKLGNYQRLYYSLYGLLQAYGKHCESCSVSDQ